MHRVLMAVSWLTTGAEVAQVSEAVGKIGRMLLFTGDKVRNASTAARCGACDLSFTARRRERPDEEKEERDQASEETMEEKEVSATEL